MHLAGPYFEIESIDRTHAAKAQRHLFERERAGFRRSIEQSPDQIGPRDDGAVLIHLMAHYILGSCTEKHAGSLKKSRAAVDAGWLMMLRALA